MTWDESGRGIALQVPRGKRLFCSVGGGQGPSPNLRPWWRVVAVSGLSKSNGLRLSHRLVESHATLVPCPLWRLPHLLRGSTDRVLVAERLSRCGRLPSKSGRICTAPALRRANQRSGVTHQRRINFRPHWPGYLPRIRLPARLVQTRTLGLDGGTCTDGLHPRGRGSWRSSSLGPVARSVG